MKMDDASTAGIVLAPTPSRIARAEGRYNSLALARKIQDACHEWLDRPGVEEASGIAAIAEAVSIADAILTYHAEEKD